MRDLNWWFSGNLLGPIRRFAAAVVITAGPWLVAVVALGVVSLSLQPVLGRPALEDLHLTVVYAFCMAPLVSGPIGTVAARLVRLSLDEDGGRMVSAIFLAAAIASGLLTQVLAVAVCIALGISPLGTALGFVFLSVAAAFLWISFSVLSALRSYRFLIAAFSTGMALTVALSMLTIKATPTAELLVWSFTAGLVLCVSLSIAHAGRACGLRRQDLPEAARILANECWKSRHLCIGVLLAIAGVWADKWFFWFGPNAARSAAGFLHFSPYDSVMFIAQLSIVPTFAAMHLFHGSEIDASISVFRETLRRRSTYQVIRDSVERLAANVWKGVFGIAFIQGTLTTAFVLMSPFLAMRMHFGFPQFLLLQVGLIAVFLQSMFYLFCTVLLLCNCGRLFMLVQLLFLTANVTASLLFYALFGVTAYAIFASSLLVATISFVLAYRAISAYDYIIFVDENESLYADTRIGWPELLNPRLLKDFLVHLRANFLAASRRAERTGATSSGRAASGDSFAEQ